MTEQEIVDAIIATLDSMDDHSISPECREIMAQFAYNLMVALNEKQQSEIFVVQVGQLKDRLEGLHGTGSRDSTDGIEGR